MLGLTWSLLYHTQNNDIINFHLGTHSNRCYQFVLLCTTTIYTCIYIPSNTDQTNSTSEPFSCSPGQCTLNSPAFWAGRRAHWGSWLPSGSCPQSRCSRSHSSLWFRPHSAPHRRTATAAQICCWDGRQSSSSRVPSWSCFWSFPWHLWTFPIGFAQACFSLYRWHSRGRWEPAECVCCVWRVLFAGCWALGSRGECAEECPWVLPGKISLQEWHGLSCRNNTGFWPQRVPFPVQHSSRAEIVSVREWFWLLCHREWWQPLNSRY